MTRIFDRIQIESSSLNCSITIITRIKKNPPGQSSNKHRNNMSIHKSRRQRTRRGGEDITPERNKPIVDQRCTKRDPFQKSRVITSSTLICFLPIPRRGIEIPASTTRNCGSKRGTEQRDGIRNARRASFHRCREEEEEEEEGGCNRKTGGET